MKFFTLVAFSAIVLVLNAGASAGTLLLPLGIVGLIAAARLRGRSNAHA